jgi:hypothetical protein
LVKQEFFDLVFLQNHEVQRIAPTGQDRTLRAVAQRAIDLRHPHLSNKWDLAANIKRMRNQFAGCEVLVEPLALCEAADGERQYGRWYLQDGSHRALAYATLILLGEAPYAEQRAYFAMSNTTHQNLLRSAD